MPVKIGHAVCDENGGKIGPKPGDQTGREIRIDDWYVSGDGWDYLLVCKDKKMAKKAAEYMKAICLNDRFGYSQPHRWSGYDSLVKTKMNFHEAKGDFDCSSLVIACYIFAGLNIPAEGYTGDMRKRLMATGKFKSYKASKYVSSDAYAEPGAIYIREGHHTCMGLDYGAKKGGNNKPICGITYYEAYKGDTNSIVDALNSLGIDSSMTNRRKIAVANGISLYVGLASQNTKMLNLLKAGKLRMI